MLFLIAFRNDILSWEFFLTKKIRTAFHSCVKLAQKRQWSDIKKKQQTNDAAGATHHISVMSPQQKSTTCCFDSFPPPLFPSYFLCSRLKWEEVRCEERGWGIQDVKNWEMRKGGDVGGLAWSLKTSPLRPKLWASLQTANWRVNVFTCCRK